MKLLTEQGAPLKVALAVERINQGLREASIEFGVYLGYPSIVDEPTEQSSPTKAKPVSKEDVLTMSDYHGRWFGILITIILSAVFVGAIMRANPHHPEVVWPDADRSIAEIRYTGSKPVDPDYLDKLLKAYKLDEACIVGKKYGAVCEDGAVIHNADPDVCANNGGVKEWVTCK